MPSMPLLARSHDAHRPGRSFSAEYMATFCPGRADRHRQDITLGLPEVAQSHYKLHDPFETEKLGVYLGQTFSAGFTSNLCGST